MESTKMIWIAQKGMDGDCFILYVSVFDTNFHVQIIISNRLIAWASGYGDHHQEQILTHLQP
jgi:hypothetical protein